MGTIFNCVTPCRFDSNVAYFPSVHTARRSDTQLRHQCGLAQPITFGT